MEKKIILGPGAVAKARECGRLIRNTYERVYKDVLREPCDVWTSGVSCTISVSVQADEVWCSSPLLSQGQSGSIARSWEGLFGVVLSCNGNNMTFGELLQLTDISPRTLSQAKSRVLAAERAALADGLRDAQNALTNGLIEVQEGAMKKLRALEMAKASCQAKCLAAETAYRTHVAEHQQLLDAPRGALAAAAGMEDEREVRTRCRFTYVCVVISCFQGH